MLKLSPVLGDETTTGMVSVLVAWQILQVKVLSPIASVVAGLDTTPSSQLCSVALGRILFCVLVQNLQVWVAAPSSLQVGGVVVSQSPNVCS